jgi:hypothetical protein
MAGSKTEGPRRAAKRGPKGRSPSPKPSTPRPPDRRAAAGHDAPPRAVVKRSIYRAAVAFVALGLLLGGAYWYSTRPRGESAEAKRLVAQAPSASRAAGCSLVHAIGPYAPASLDRAHIGTSVPTLPPLSSYPSVPPTSGPHDPTPLDAGVYADPPPIARAIHSLEHGAVILWYPPADRRAARALTTFFGQAANRDHVIVAPYDYPDQGTAGRLPPGVGMAEVAWHRLQTCATPSLPVAAAFVQRFATPTQAVPFGRPRGYEGEAPEAGYAI